MSIEQGNNTPETPLEMAQNNINTTIDRNPSVVAEAMDPFRAEAILQEGAIQVAEGIKVKDLPGYNPNYRPDTPKVIYIPKRAQGPTSLQRAQGLNQQQGPTSLQRAQELNQKAHNMRMGG